MEGSQINYCEECSACDECGAVTEWPVICVRCDEVICDECDGYNTRGKEDNCCWACLKSEFMTLFAGEHDTPVSMNDICGDEAIQEWNEDRAAYVPYRPEPGQR